MKQIRIGLLGGETRPLSEGAARDLLQRNPHPSEDEIREGIEGNLCRCTGYHNIVKAVMAAAETSRGSISETGPSPQGRENVQELAEEGLGA